MSENLDLVRSIYAAWESGDYGSVEWADPEIEWVFADGPEPARWQLTEIARGWRKFLSAWKEFRITVEEFSELEDERVLVLTRYSGRGKTSGLHLDTLAAKGASIFDLRNGKVTRQAFYLDREQALADLGLQSKHEPLDRDAEPAVGESSGAYALGHSEQELDRLQVQARLIEPITRRFLGEAGLKRGMRVLDIGSGVGDVAFLAAEMVGEQGEVVGVDRSGEALAIARERAQANALGNVAFREGDPAELTFERPFDAVIGRYVLMFQPDPTAMLASVSAHVRAGGVVVFHEPEWACARSFPAVPSWDRCCELVVQAMTAKGTDMQLGMKLHSIFIAAGLPGPSMRLESVIGAGATSSDQVRYTTDVALTLLADMEKLGLIGRHEIDPTTLAEDILKDVAASGSVIVGRSEIGAWSRCQP